MYRPTESSLSPKETETITSEMIADIKNAMSVGNKTVISSSIVPSIIGRLSPLYSEESEENSDESKEPDEKNHFSGFYLSGEGYDYHSFSGPDTSHASMLKKIMPWVKKMISYFLKTKVSSSSFIKESEFIEESESRIYQGQILEGYFFRFNPNFFQLPQLPPEHPKKSAAEILIAFINDATTELVELEKLEKTQSSTAPNHSFFASEPPREKIKKEQKRGCCIN